MAAVMSVAAEHLHKIGFVDIEQWTGAEHRVCEAPRHAGLGHPAVVVIALAMLCDDGELDHDQTAVWGACIECFGLMDQDMAVDWRLPGRYGSDGR